ncbi:hypothetical protein VHUM_02863 [Vanrija humicola]|uniref:Calcineurin-like phosphoesterase domain-containing protein n=1 Tax=Vanrija humicola TaxID=5417 RepID=A0A7D8UYL4_VANHU|nr:hypothetical protein VHUM_02863 [Vanrija humicola]
MRRSGLRSRGTQLMAFRFASVVLVIWYERPQFFYSLSSCRFPDAVLRAEGGADSAQAPTHVVLIADPHVPHPSLSHPTSSPDWVNAVRQGMEELFMRKSWNVVRRLGRIDAVIVVGDILDCGREFMTDKHYDEYYQIFRSIFKLHPTTDIYFVPGNHDIGLGPPGTFSPLARRRFQQHFGDLNAVVSVANHSLILLDSVGLIEEDRRRYAAEVQYGEWSGIAGGVIEFVQGLGRDPPANSILISHVPLARPDTVSCGPLREYGTIQKGVGLGYQNLLGGETSEFLLEALRPTIVFSGDDHDYCDITHKYGIREVTLKSFSSSAGIQKPGLQLLSLIPPQEGALSHADVPCFLPDQLGVYNWIYLPFILITFAYLLLTNMRSALVRPSHHHHHPGDRSPKPRNSPRPDEKRRERPVLTTTRSSQNLQGLTATARGRQHLSARTSAPNSPHLSPRIPYDDNESELGDGYISPALSRRSSYGGDLNEAGATTPPLLRMSSGLPSPIVQSTTARRVALPRLPSASDWVASARAKDTSVISLGAAHGHSYFAKVAGSLRWLWRTRNSVVVKSIRELLSVILPAAIVWVIVNAIW